MNHTLGGEEISKTLDSFGTRAIIGVRGDIRIWDGLASKSYKTNKKAIRVIIFNLRGAGGMMEASLKTRREGNRIVVGGAGSLQAPSTMCKGREPQDLFVRIVQQHLAHIVQQRPAVNQILLQSILEEHGIRTQRWIRGLCRGTVT